MTVYPISYFRNIFTSAMEANNRSFINLLASMAVTIFMSRPVQGKLIVLVHLVKYAHLGPHFYLHPLGSVRNVSRSEFVCT